MIIDAVEYSAPAGLSLEQVKQALGKHFVCSPLVSKQVRCTYYDTFDWRIYADGGALEVTPQDKKLAATWVALDGGRRLEPVVLDRQPRFVEDISSSPLWRRLSSTVAMRAMLPQFEVTSEVEVLALLNRDRKTVVRVQLATEKVSESYNGKSLEAITCLKFVPFKGYGKSCARAIRMLSKEFDLTTLEGDFVQRTLTRFGRRPVDPSKLWVDLSPDMDAEEALKRVLLHLQDTVDINEAGTRTNVDSEFLHDFRVAVRRTRSALSQVKGVFPDDALEKFTPELKWLGEITGPTRDLDVYLLTFDKYKESLPEFQQEHLEPLRRFLHIHQKKEQQKMATALGSLRYRELKGGWRHFLESPVAGEAAAQNVARPTIEVVSGRIWRVYKRVIKEGRAIGPETPAVVLHDLRKTCKKLRYLMELFQALYPPGQLKRLIKALKLLQENLGDFQDLEVQALTLKVFGQRMLEEGHVEVDTLFAMGTLVVGLHVRQEKARQAFSACFDEFAGAGNRKLFKEVFIDQVKTQVSW